MEQGAVVNPAWPPPAMPKPQAKAKDACGLKLLAWRRVQCGGE